MESLSDEELSKIDAQAGPVTISVENDTVRLFFDTYIETYAEIDRVRLGYYYKDKRDLVTRKGLNPGVPLGTGIDPRIVDREMVTSGGGTHVTYKVDYTDYALANGDNAGGATTPTRYAVEYMLAKKHNGHGEYVTEYVPWTDDDLYMAKYNDKLGEKWVDGVQGDNNKTATFSAKNYQNRNYLDWDISLDNVRLGSSPENPAIINGLVIRLKYKNMNDEAKRELTDIIIGTNDMQADLMVDFRRATGFYSAVNAYRARRKSLQEGEGFNFALGTDLGQEFNLTPVPVILQRDSMLMLVDHFYFGRNYSDASKESFMSAVPDNPANNNAHSGIFLRIGLDRTSPHFGFQLITGYNEQVACAFQYRGEHLNESLRRWWENDSSKPAPEVIHWYPDYLPKKPYYPDVL